MGNFQTIDEFCRAERMSRSHFYLLRELGRAPEITFIGGLRRIGPENVAAWRKQMQENPIKGGLRPAVLQRRATKAA